jgi:hypothetical protein
MTTEDYPKEMDENPRVNWRKIFTSPYNDKTHFVYELIQNADDSKSTRLEFHLRGNELVVWNDGQQFTEKDVDSICSIGFSNKDLTQIGTFGMGITAVFTYTDCLEVYSGDEHFRIQIKDPTKRENIDFDEIDSIIIDQLDKGRTVFRLPFRKKLRQKDIEKLRDRLCNLGEKRPLLFLRYLERVEWRDELSAQIGFYFCHRCPHDKMQDASEVELTMSLDDNNQRAETFLVFRKEVQPPQDVISELLLQTEEDKDEHQRIRKSVEKPQPVEVAFRLQNGKIIVMTDRCMLFSYLSTQKETHLRFIIQARYQTTLARDNIEEIEDNLWNGWLVRETANFLPEVLGQLKAGGLLEPTFFDVLPLKGEVEKAFKPIAKASRKAMKERSLIPTEDGGYAKAENVFYPESTPLRKLVKSSGMHSDSSLLHPYIRKDTKESGRCFDVMAGAGVKEIDESDILCWLEKQSRDWFKNRTNEWLRSLYVYFNRKWSESEWERIKKIPLVRLENGKHVCVSNQLVYFPPDMDEEREEIEPFLNELPILHSDFFEGEDRNDIEAFLESLGGEALCPANMIREWIIPQYSQSDKPSENENLSHVYYLFKIWDKLSGYEHRSLREELSKTPILWAYNGVKREIYDFVAPCNVYLPKAYTSDDNLETYFSVYDRDVWFVDDVYLADNPEAKAWFQFLKMVGAMDTPRIMPEKLSIFAHSSLDAQKLNQELDKRGINKQRSTQGHTIEDFHLDGLSEASGKVGKYSKLDFSRTIWQLLLKSLPSEESKKKKFFQGTYHWSYYGDKSAPFESTFYRQLKETPWLPDEQGNLQVPANCFAPTDDNRRVLGDSVAYLHPDFDVSQDNETARWLAEKLGIHLNANTNSVINYLQTLSGTETSVEKVEPLYRFLARQDARRSEEFKQKPLIFTSNPEPNWWQADEVFWVNESPVFGSHRGYLKDDYEETLKGFFIGLGVRESAAPLDYVHAIQDVTSEEQANNMQVQKRIEILYRRLWLSLQENKDLLEDEEWQAEWEQVREDACWLGREGDEWGFFSPQELVWNDHPYLARIFEGKIPFWGFSDELLELARDSGIEGCSQASVECLPLGDQEDDGVWSRKAQDLCSGINAFLKSSSLCDRSVEGKSAEVLSQLSVRRVEELEVTYELNGISVIDIEARQSFLSKTNQGVMLWLALEAKEDEYAELIGDALQDYFGVKELRGFVEDLLTKDRDRVLTRWKRDGLRVDLCESTPEMDSKESEKIPSESVDEELPDETGSRDNSGTNDSDVETPAVHDEPETEDEDDDSTENESEGDRTYTPDINPTSQPTGHWKGTSNGRSGRGGHGGRGGGGPSEKHEKLKKDLAEDPSDLGEGLKLIREEYPFGSGDRADILFQDSSENPVTVEVEAHIPSGNYVGVWQAVKYQHLAAMEYSLACEQVRSILAAPKIPEDVKEKCEELGIEPFEIPD